MGFTVGRQVGTLSCSGEGGLEISLTMLRRKFIDRIGKSLVFEWTKSITCGGAHSFVDRSGMTSLRTKDASVQGVKTKSEG